MVMATVSVTDDAEVWCRVFSTRSTAVATASSLNRFRMVAAVNFEGLEVIVSGRNLARLEDEPRKASSLRPSFSRAVARLFSAFT